MIIPKILIDEQTDQPRKIRCKLYHTYGGGYDSRNRTKLSPPTSPFLSEATKCSTFWPNRPLAGQPTLKVFFLFLCSLPALRGGGGGGALRLRWGEGGQSYFFLRRDRSLSKPLNKKTIAL